MADIAAEMTDAEIEAAALAIAEINPNCDTAVCTYRANENCHCGRIARAALLAAAASLRGKALMNIDLGAMQQLINALDMARSDMRSLGRLEDIEGVIDRARRYATFLLFDENPSDVTAALLRWEPPK